MMLNINKCLLCDKDLPPKTGYTGGRSKLYCDGACRQKNYRNKHLYSLMNKDYRLMMARMTCDICHKEVKLVTDHSHITGKARGGLCHECNKALGQFHDNQELIASALKYLQKYDG